jgi:hypothetical protein
VEFLSVTFEPLPEKRIDENGEFFQAYASLPGFLQDLSSILVKRTARYTSQPGYSRYLYLYLSHGIMGNKLEYLQSIRFIKIHLKLLSVVILVPAIHENPPLHSTEL